MKKGMLLFLLCCSIIMVFIGCDDSEFGPWHKFVTIQNNSDRHLIIGISVDYPNTSKIALSKADTCPPYQSADYIVGFYRNELFEMNPIIELYIYDRYDIAAYYANDKVPLQDLIEQLPKADILLKRYELTREWLEQHDWTVTYP